MHAAWIRAPRHIDESGYRGYALRQMDRREPRDERDRDRKRLEGVLPELIKRLVEAGVEKIAEGPGNVRQLVSDLRLPKDMLTFLLSQIDDTKTGLYRVTAKEIRDFLDHTDFAEQFAKVLTTLSFEIKTEVRFIPNDSRAGLKPDVKAKVKVKRADRRKAAAEAAQAADAAARTSAATEPPTDPEPKPKPVPDPGIKHPAGQSPASAQQKESEK